MPKRVMLQGVVVSDKQRQDGGGARSSAASRIRC